MFEIELVKQVEINVDEVLMLVEHDRKARVGDDKEICAAIERAIDSSPSLRNKKDLIDAFVDSLSASAEVDRARYAFASSAARDLAIYEDFRVERVTAIEPA